MANNHQGKLDHGLKIIEEVAKVSNEAGVRGALKFQFRHLDTFIHKDYRKATQPKHIPRFLGTEMSDEDFSRMASMVKEKGLITIATPFDEASVDLIETLNIEIIKIASCSTTDYPLLERISQAGKPVIISTGGSNIEQIDTAVDFLEQRGVDFAIMHCVPLYPTAPEDLQLNQIYSMSKRYPNHVIGWSTHEDPDNLNAVKMAYAKGARIFERHVGVETKDIKLNKYSSRPHQLKAWLEAHKEAVISCGADYRPPAREDVTKSLQSLKRGVFANKPIKKGQKLLSNDVFFAMPLLDEKLDVSKFFDGILANRDYNANEALDVELALQKKTTVRDDIIKGVLLEIRGMINNARIKVNPESSVELSHHYGIERLREFGAVIVNCINNDEYCKKYVILLPSQKHPYHFHKKKKETFQVLYGTMELEIDGNVHKLKPGDILDVERGQWHKFSSGDGVIFEEVSTTSYPNDSFYEDERISLLPRNERKTYVELKN